MNRFLIFFLLAFALSSTAQPFVIDSAARVIAPSPGDELFPSWSPDGSFLLFQSDRYGNNDIFLFDLQRDSLFRLTQSTSNEERPVWHPGTGEVVFDSDSGGVRFLYAVDPEGGEPRFLFRRKVQCKEAAFSPKGRLVYFSAYDEHRKHWELYSYDFRSDNLNPLFRFAGECRLPAVSPDGKKVVFGKETKRFPFSTLTVLNWYGNVVIDPDTMRAEEACWGADGLKIYFVSRRDKKSGEVYSIWKDGTHLERLTRDELTVRCPAVSPDGRFIALSVLRNGNFELVVIPLSE